MSGRIRDCPKCWKHTYECIVGDYWSCAACEATPPTEQPSPYACNQLYEVTIDGRAFLVTTGFTTKVVAQLPFSTVDNNPGLIGRGHELIVTSNLSCHVVDRINHDGVIYIYTRYKEREKDQYLYEIQGNSTRCWNLPLESS